MHLLSQNENREAENRRAIHEEKTRDGESVKAYIPTQRKKKSLIGFVVRRGRIGLFVLPIRSPFGKSPHKQGHLYYFFVESCRDCPYREDCPHKRMVSVTDDAAEGRALGNRMIKSRKGAESGKKRRKQLSNLTDTHRN